VTIASALRATGAGGGDGDGAGGGGGGGNVVLAGETIAITGSIDVAGGVGGATSGPGTGGDGGEGRIRIDSDVSGTIPGEIGVAFATAGVDLIVDTASYVIRGRAQPGAMVRIEAIDRPAVTAAGTAAADGTFELTVTLEEGLNRIRLFSGSGATELRAWNGTSFESFRSGTSTMPDPVGGILDVAYVPPG